MSSYFGAAIADAEKTVALVWSGFELFEVDFGDVASAYEIAVVSVVVAAVADVADADVAWM